MGMYACVNNASTQDAETGDHHEFKASYLSSKF